MFCVEKSLNLVEHFLLHEYEIIVDFDDFHEDSYYKSCNLIEINTKQSKLSQLYGLLHEASHVILGHGAVVGTETTLQEEKEAWQYGKELAKTLNIEIEEENYDFESRKSIYKYSEHFKRKKR